MPVFSYETAFCRNIGILSAEEQAKLRRSRVAIVGLGGMGGIYAQALARLGVGRFAIADGDHFEMANFNRQFGGTMESIDCNKARAAERQIRAVNPEAEIDVREQHMDSSNLVGFLYGADLVLDAIDAFAVSAHRLLLRECRSRKLPVVLSAPMGFSSVMAVFDPAGMSADEYFAWEDSQDYMESLALFILGLAPHLSFRSQLDLRHVDVAGRVGPSNVAACLIGAGMAATEVCRLLLKRPGTYFVPRYVQMDPYDHCLSRGHLRWGNRGPLQRLKKYLLMSRYERLTRERTTAAVSATGH